MFVISLDIQKFKQSYTSSELSREISDLSSETIRDVADLSSLVFHTLSTEISDLSSDTSNEIADLSEAVFTRINVEIAGLNFSGTLLMRVAKMMPCNMSGGMPWSRAWLKTVARIGSSLPAKTL